MTQGLLAQGVHRQNHTLLVITRWDQHVLIIAV